MCYHSEASQAAIHSPEQSERLETGESTALTSGVILENEKTKQEEARLWEAKLKPVPV